jgi:hypothetical protein
MHQRRVVQPLKPALLVGAADVRLDEGGAERKARGRPRKFPVGQEPYLAKKRARGPAAGGKAKRGRPREQEPEEAQRGEEQQEPQAQAGPSAAAWGGNAGADMRTPGAPRCAELPDEADEEVEADGDGWSQAEVDALQVRQATLQDPNTMHE